MACALERTRLARGLSKEAIIRETGLTKPTVYKALRGEPVNRATTRLIATVLDVSLEELAACDAPTADALAGVS